MKRLFSICLIASLLMLPLGCSGGDTGTKDAGSGEKATGTSGDKGDEGSATKDEGSDKN